MLGSLNPLKFKAIKWHLQKVSSFVCPPLGEYRPEVPKCKSSQSCMRRIEILCCPLWFILHFFHKNYTVSTARSFLQSLSPGLGICWPSLCEGWGLLCPSQVLTRNDVSPTEISSLHTLETWWKYLRVNVWWTHELSILTFCNTFERTSWNSKHGHPPQVSFRQTHWNFAWPGRPSSFKSALEP